MFHSNILYNIKSGRKKIFGVESPKDNSLCWLDLIFYVELKASKVFWHRI